MKHIDPAILVFLGVAIAVMGFLLSVIGGYISGTSWSEAGDPTGPGVYRRMPLGFYMKVPAPVDLNDLNVEYRFIPDFLNGSIVYADEEGVFHRVPSVDEEDSK